MSKKIIAMMTDFGLEDIYVGVMKGVILGICGDAHIIDISHHIPPQSVFSGALYLKNSYGFFPKDTVFLTIVDPDVGSTRLPIAVKAGDYTFVAPDNGVLSHVLTQLPIHEAVTIQNRRYALPEVSATFHGRDIFSPAAAHLANGVLLSELGNPLHEFVRLTMPPLIVKDGYIVGGIAHVDHFGNVITNIGTLRWRDADTLILDGHDVTFSAKHATIHMGDVVVQGIKHAYYEVPEGELLAQIDSTGSLEVAIYKGNAQTRLGVKNGDTVEIRFSVG